MRRRGGPGLDGGQTYQDGLANHNESRTVGATMAVCEVVCEVCFWTFRRESDKKRHKCVAERQKPISEQSGVAQCQVCQSCLAAEVGWQAIDADWEASAAEISRDEPVAL